MMNETEIAIKESETYAASDAYFQARPNTDCSTNRKLFEAGFARGWDAARPIYPDGLTDAQIDVVADAMPGGVTGFLVRWGWRHYARAIEAAHGLRMNK